MKITEVAAIGAFLSLGLLEPSQPQVCPDDSVPSGTVCIDKYEASVWIVPPEERAVILKIQRGSVDLQDLVAAGAIQLGLAAGDLAAAGCPANGNGCVAVYAVSIPGVTPAGFVTYFQAVAAARNASKRLPTNQEWQAAALGTPDGAPCNVRTDAVIANTGSAPGCVSDVGAFDMVGNRWERVAEWVDFAANCGAQSAEFGGDLICFGGPPADGPTLSAMLRGGAATGFQGGGTQAGVFAIRANVTPDFSPGSVGFRSVR